MLSEIIKQLPPFFERSLYKTDDVEPTPKSHCWQPVKAKITRMGNKREICPASLHR
jgi:hypothetical protein